MAVYSLDRSMMVNLKDIIEKVELRIFHWTCAFLEKLLSATQLGVHKERSEICAWSKRAQTAATTADHQA